MAFKTKEKADYFIANYDEFISGDIEFKPIRSFYCNSCNMWHITHMPLTPEMLNTEERDQKIHELQILASRLKSEFRIKDWIIWKGTVEEGIATLDSFKVRDGFEKLVETLEPTLNHFDSVIQTLEAKENDSANEEFKQTKKSLEKNAKELDFYQFMVVAKRMMSRFSDNNLKKAIHPSSRLWYSQFASFMNHEETTEILRDVMEQASDSIADSRDVHVNDLYEQVLSMTLCMDKLLILGLPKDIWDVLQSKVKKVANVLENSFVNTKTAEGFSLMENVRIKANECMLDEISNRIKEGNNELALSMLKHVDERMHPIPLSNTKLELMTRMCSLGSFVVH